MCPCSAVAESLLHTQSSGTPLAPVQAPLGNLAPLRGLAASPAGILRGSLNSDVGSSVDSSLVAKGGTQVRLCHSGNVPWKARSAKGCRHCDI